MNVWLDIPSNRGQLWLDCPLSVLQEGSCPFAPLPYLSAKPLFCFPLLLFLKTKFPNKSKYCEIWSGAFSLWSYQPEERGREGDEQETRLMVTKFNQIWTTIDCFDLVGVYLLIKLFNLFYVMCFHHFPQPMILWQLFYKLDISINAATPGMHKRKYRMRWPYVLFYEEECLLHEEMWTPNLM